MWLGLTRGPCEERAVGRPGGPCPCWAWAAWPRESQALSPEGFGHPNPVLGGGEHPEKAWGGGQAEHPAQRGLGVAKEPRARPCLGYSRVYHRARGAKSFWLDFPSLVTCPQESVCVCTHISAGCHSLGLGSGLSSCPAFMCFG